jgi:hypothetical protein
MYVELNISSPSLFLSLSTLDYKMIEIYEERHYNMITARNGYLQNYLVNKLNS